MVELLGGAMMIAGGGSLIASSIVLARAGRAAIVADVVASLPFTPLPAPDAELEQLLAAID